MKIKNRGRKAREKWERKQERRATAKPPIGN